MATTKVILTNYGNDRILEALANDTTVTVSAIAYGDGGGSNYDPLPTQTNLVNQLGTISVITKTFDSTNGFIYINGTIQANAPEFTLRELGVLDDTNHLIAIAVVPDTSKPSMSEGIEVSLPLSIGFKTSAGSVLVVDYGSSEVSSKQWCLDNFQLLSEKGQNNGYAPLNDSGIVPANNSLVRYSILNNTTYQGQEAKNVIFRKEDNMPIIPYVDKANPALDNITNAAFSVVGTRSLQNFPVVTKTWSSTINLSDNCINYISDLTGTTTLRVPDVTDTSVLHQMLVLLRMSTVRTIYHRDMQGNAIGNFYNETPDMSEAGYYTLIYEYSGSKWYVGSIYKGVS